MRVAPPIQRIRTTVEGYRLVAVGGQVKGIVFGIWPDGEPVYVVVREGEGEVFITVVPAFHVEDVVYADGTRISAATDKEDYGHSIAKSPIHFHRVLICLRRFSNYPEV